MPDLHKKFAKCVLAGGAVPGLLLKVVVGLSIAAPGRADDWPGWRGAGRDGLCHEKDLLQSWPPGGPKLLWKVTGLGEGYSSPSICGDLLYTMGNRDGKEWVIALKWAEGGREAWRKAIGPVRHKGGGYPGPRSTPTLSVGRLYTLGINGDLVCMDARSGELIWRRDLVSDFSGEIPEWGYSESLLVDGNLILCTPGGKRGTVLALSKTEGRLVWLSPPVDKAAYSSIVRATLGGRPQYVQLGAHCLFGVCAETGRLFWRFDKLGRTHANVSTPVTHNETVFATSGYRSGAGVLLQFEKGPKGPVYKVRYITKHLRVHLGGVVLVDGYLYGCDSPRTLTCMEYETGRVMWTDRSCGSGCSLIYAGGMLYVRSERGRMSLVRATPAGFELCGRFEQPYRTRKHAWTPPAIAAGRLYLRDQDILLCYDIRRK